MRLKAGDTISELSLPSVSGDIFDIKSLKGKKALITFYRFATCPFCNLRISELSERYNEFGNNLSIVGIFEAPIDFLVETMAVHDVPFTFLADEEFKYFKKYDVEQSAWKFMLGSSLKFPRMLKAFSKGYIPLKIKGSILTVPADILVNERGIIEKVYYGKNTADHLSFEAVKEFSLT